MVGVVLLLPAGLRVHRHGRGDVLAWPCRHVVVHHAGGGATLRADGGGLSRPNLPSVEQSGGIAVVPPFGVATSKLSEIVPGGRWVYGIVWE